MMAGGLGDRRYARDDFGWNFVCREFSDGG